MAIDFDAPVVEIEKRYVRFRVISRTFDGIQGFWSEIYGFVDVLFFTEISERYSYFWWPLLADTGGAVAQGFL